MKSPERPCVGQSTSESPTMSCRGECVDPVTRRWINERPSAFHRGKHIQNARPESNGWRSPSRCSPTKECASRWLPIPKVYQPIGMSLIALFTRTWQIFLDLLGLFAWSKFEIIEESFPGESWEFRSLIHYTRFDCSSVKRGQCFTEEQSNAFVSQNVENTNRLPVTVKSLPLQFPVKHLVWLIDTIMNSCLYKLRCLAELLKICFGASKQTACVLYWKSSYSFVVFSLHFWVDLLQIANSISRKLTFSLPITAILRRIFLFPSTLILSCLKISKLKDLITLVHLQLSRTSLLLDLSMFRSN